MMLTVSHTERDLSYGALNKGGTFQSSARLNSPIHLGR